MSPTPESPTRALFRPLRRGEWRLGWLALGLFILAGLPWRLDNLGQTRAAYASLEIAQAGHWGFEHTPGGRDLAADPPLVAWISAALFHLTGGHWEIAWRLPSLVAALAVLAFLWRAGESLWPGWGGTLAAAAFALNLLVPGLATAIGSGMPQTLFVTLIGLLVWRHAGQTWRAGGRRGSLFLGKEGSRGTLPTFSPERWLVFSLLSAALLTRGLSVYALLLPGMVAHTVILRWRAKRQTEVAGPLVQSDLWGGWWHWTFPLLPFLFWLERGMVTVPGFFHQVVLPQLTGGFAGGAPITTPPVTGEPIYYYFARLLALWTPWSVLLLAVRLRGAGVWWSLWRDPRNLWLVCWAAGGLITLTLAPAKNLDRLLPILPPLCLLMVAALRCAEQAGMVRREEAAEGMLPTVANHDEMAAAAPVEIVPADWPRAWSHLTLRVALALATGGALYGAGRAFWEGANAQERFGADARAATVGRRLELVSPLPTTDDEALLVSLRRLEFLTPVQALQLWTTGRVDALVFSAPAVEKSRGLLEPVLPLDHPALAAPAQNGRPGYLLFTRDPNTPPLTVPYRRKKKP